MAENTETVPSHDQPTTVQAPESSSQQENTANTIDDTLYRAFDSYPWQKDQTFTAQLLEALHTYVPNGPSLAEIALQARVRRFQEQTKIQVNPGSYRQWLTHTNANPPRIVSEEVVVQEAMAVPSPEERRLARLLVELGDELGTLSLQYQSVPVPSWQAAAPKAELYIKKDASPTDPDKEPYPKKFEEIVEFLKTGKEIPGIRKIPDTVVEDPTITTQGRLKAPPKPWEIGRVPSTDDASAPLADNSG